MVKFYELESAANYNNIRFSVLAVPERCEIKFDILELKYHIKTRLLWFLLYWRRREDEKITVMGIDSDIYVDVNEINNLPLFQRKITNVNINDEEVFSKAVIDYINENEDVLEALILKYKNQLCNKIYNGENNEYMIIDRWCSPESLYKKVYEIENDEEISEKEKNKLIHYTIRV